MIFLHMNCYTFLTLTFAVSLILRREINLLIALTIALLYTAKFYCLLNYLFPSVFH